LPITEAGEASVFVAGVFSGGKTAECRLIERQQETLDLLTQRGVPSQAVSRKAARSAGGVRELTQILVRLSSSAPGSYDRSSSKTLIAML